MAAPPAIDRFTLYGEGNGALPPEFVHIEPISERSRLHEGTIAPHSHPEIFQLLLLAAGCGALASDGDEAALAPGALVALPAGCVHAFRFDDGAEGWVLSIAVDLLKDPRISALCAPARRPGGGPRWAQAGARASERLGALLADLAEALAGDRAGKLPDAVAARLALVLVLVEEQLSLPDAVRGNRREHLVDGFRAQVDLHFRDGWNLVEYARVLGTTTVTLARACRGALGKAPGEIVLDRVLLEAMRSLTYSTASVRQIAYDLGFADNAYFARFFKARSGMTASAFRRTRGWFTGAARSAQARAVAERDR